MWQFQLFFSSKHGDFVPFFRKESSVGVVVPFFFGQQMGKFAQKMGHAFFSGYSSRAFH
jgi:hypothetical protein